MRRVKKAVILYIICTLVPSLSDAYETKNKVLKMVIAVGSTNPVKVQAVTEVAQSYSNLAGAEILAYEVSSEVASEPLSLAETIQGAKSRAKNAFVASGSCQYSFGIESGLLEAPGTQSGYLETTVCCVYDGLHYYTGLSLGVEIPPQLLHLVLEKKMDLGQACYHSGITSKSNLGASEGLIGLLTRGRIDRLRATKICIMTALIQLENSQWYTEGIEKLMQGNN